MSKTETLRQSAAASNATRLEHLAEQMETLRQAKHQSAEDLAATLEPLAQAMAALTDETRQTLAEIERKSQEQGETFKRQLSESVESYKDAAAAASQAAESLNQAGQRLVNQDRNSFAASMVSLGYADGMVTGVTRSYDQVLEEVLRVVDPEPDGRIMGMSVVLAKGHTLFIADTSITEMPDAEELVEIAVEAARTVKTLGYEPRVAFMSYSTFGNPMGMRSEKVRDAVAMLDMMDVDFEYEGEMTPVLALDPSKRVNYPFMRLNGPANVLIMPAIHSASISTQLVQALGGATVIGPMLLGLTKSVQIAPLSASVARVLQMATLAAYEQDLAEAQA